MVHLENGVIIIIYYYNVKAYIVAEVSGLRSNQ